MYPQRASLTQILSIQSLEVKTYSGVRHLGLHAVLIWQPDKDALR